MIRFRDLFNEDLVEEAHSVSFIHPESGLRKRFNVIGAKDYHSAKRVVASHLGLKNTRHVRANKRRITWEHVEPVLADGTLHEGGFQHGFYHVKRDGNVLRPTHGAPMSSEDAAHHAKTVGGEYAFSNGRGEWHEAGLKKTPVQYRGMARNHMMVRGKYTPLGDTLVDDR